VAEDRGRGRGGQAGEDRPQGEEVRQVSADIFLGQRPLVPLLLLGPPFFPIILIGSVHHPVNRDADSFCRQSSPHQLPYDLKQ
jgi:hypothetical protein